MFKIARSLAEILDLKNISEHDKKSFDERVLKNTKIKIYPDGSTNTTYCSQYIFTDKKALEYYKEEFEERLKKENLSLEYDVDYQDYLIAKENEENKTEITNENKEYYEKRKLDKSITENVKKERERTDSVKRSRNKCFDIARLNEWKYFITITFDGSQYDFTNADFVCKKINTWLRNRAYRDGLKYLLIPEYHKKSGGIHCHALVNDKLDVVDSGTRLVSGFSKPVKLSTIKSKGLENKVYRTVYNVPKWKYGFSTAIEVDNSLNFAYYVTKYITKGNKKIFGQYYWSSRNCCREPEIVYCNTNFNNVDSSEISKPYTSVKYKYASNSYVLPNMDEIADRFDDISSFLNYVNSQEFKKEVENYESKEKYK